MIREIDFVGTPAEFDGSTALNLTDQQIERDWAGPLASVDEERQEYLAGRREYIRGRAQPGTHRPVQQMGYTGSRFAPHDVAYRRKEMGLGA